MDQLGIFAKYWQPGRVKTRLAAAIGNQSAALIYREFLVCLTEQLASFPGRRVLGFAPADRATEFRQLFPHDWQLEVQVGTDLGQRMSHYFRSAFAQGAERVVLIGSDSPTLSIGHLTEAFVALADHEVVLGPTDDGGYYLVGAAGDVPDIFRHIPWSTPEVWEATRQRLEGQGVPWCALSKHYDVDDVDDLVRLHAELAKKPFASEAFDALRSKIAAALDLARRGT